MSTKSKSRHISWIFFIESLLDGFPPAQSRLESRVTLKSPPIMILFSLLTTKFSIALFKLLKNRHCSCTLLGAFGSVGRSVFPLFIGFVYSEIVAFCRCLCTRLWSLCFRRSLRCGKRCSHCFAGCLFRSARR